MMVDCLITARIIADQLARSHALDTYLAHLTALDAEYEKRGHRRGSRNDHQRRLWELAEAMREKYTNEGSGCKSRERVRLTRHAGHTAAPVKQGDGIVMSNRSKP